MTRKSLWVISFGLIILLLGGGIVWSGGKAADKPEAEQAAERSAGKYNEAPELRELVKAGKLPPVEERISEEPLVVVPKDKIGKYGGTIKSASLAINTGGPDPRTTRMLAWLRKDLETGETMPNVAKALEVSDDMKTITMHLRKGMRWSDGHPFTTESVKFWYEDVLMNKEIIGAVPAQWSPGGEPVEVVVLDDYTFQFKFAVPFPAMSEILAYDYDEVGLHYPKHYLEKWHIKYNPKANELAKEEGFDTWWQCFNSHRAMGEQQQDPNQPDINPWVLYKITVEGDKHFKRNPFYFKVDTAGNQLPYVDEMHRIVAKNVEIMDLKMMAGEINYAGCKLSFDNFPVYKDGEERGNYRAILLDGDTRNNQGLTFNFWHKDPVLREIIRDVRFRQAMSLAMDREKVNEALYAGLSEPWAGTFSRRCSFLEEWMGKYYTEHDPDKANALLDEMGLEWDKGHKYRLRPDGKPLALFIQAFDAGSGWWDRIELKQRDWEKVGIKVDTKDIDRALWNKLRNAQELDFTASNYEADESDEQVNKRFLRFGVNHGSPWSLWWDTGGEKGEEPPTDVKDYYALVDKWSVSLRGTDEYMKLEEMLTLHTEYIWSLGDLLGGPQPAVFAENLKNTPDEGGPLIWPGARFWMIYRPDQWYFE